MMPLFDKSAIVRHIEKNDLYRHEGGDAYTLIRTGKSFEVPPDKAKEVFRINVEASFLCNKWPMIENLIKNLSLKIEK